MHVLCHITRMASLQQVRHQRITCFFSISAKKRRVLCCGSHSAKLRLGRAAVRTPPDGEVVLESNLPRGSSNMFRSIWVHSPDRIAPIRFWVTSGTAVNVFWESGRTFGMSMLHSIRKTTSLLQ